MAREEYKTTPETCHKKSNKRIKKKEEENRKLNLVTRKFAYLRQAT